MRTVSSGPRLSTATFGVRSSSPGKKDSKTPSQSVDIGRQRKLPKCRKRAGRGPSGRGGGKPLGEGKAEGPKKLKPEKKTENSMQVVRLASGQVGLTDKRSRGLQLFPA